MSREEKSEVGMPKSEVKAKTEEPKLKQFRTRHSASEINKSDPDSYRKQFTVNPILIN